MAYVSWDRGFKSGVYNLLTYASPAVNPESLDAYQAGLKSEWLQHRLRLNLAGFAYRYRNIQVESIIAGATIAMNAAAARVRGLELDLEYMPCSCLSMRAGLALLHGRYTDFDNALFSTPSRDDAGNLTGGNSVIAGDASGHRTIRSPSAALTLDALYRVPSRVGGFALGVTYSYRSRFAWDPDNRLEEHAHGFLNASIEWQSPHEAIAVRVSGNNLTGVKACTYGTAYVLGDFCSPRAPRVLSIDLSAKF
jgi:iron complex outermembrane receptor protein